MPVSFYVYTFYTKHAEGFLQSEIDKLLEVFPQIVEEDFLDILLENTCIIINHQVIMRKEDIELALFHCLKQLK
jgi:hypothetical protein